MIGYIMRSLGCFSQPNLSNKVHDYAIKRPRQPTIGTYDLCLEVLNVNGKEWQLFLAKAFPLL